MVINKKFWSTVCFLMLAGALFSCAAAGKSSNTNSQIFNYLFPGRIIEASKWFRLEDKNYPAFYREMPKEYKRLNPADAYFSEPLQAGVIVVYGKVIELGLARKVCVMEASATYYLKQASNDTMPLVEKSLYFAWEKNRVDDECSQSVPSQYTLIEGQLPMSLLEKALVNEKVFLNKCFAEREIDKRDIKLSKVALSRSLDGSDAYLHYTGSGLNVVLGLSLLDVDWHFNGCEEFFD